jgi:hypothetical protein
MKDSIVPRGTVQLGKKASVDISLTQKETKRLHQNRRQLMLIPITEVFNSLYTGTLTT